MRPLSGFMTQHDGVSLIDVLCARHARETLIIAVSSCCVIELSNYLILRLADASISANLKGKLRRLATHSRRLFTALSADPTAVKEARETQHSATKDPR